MQAMAGRSNPVNGKRAQEGCDGVRATHAVCGGLVLALVIGLACGIAGRSQQTGNNNTMNPNQTLSRGGFGHPNLSPLQSDEDYDPMLTERRMRALNTERQKQMISDTNKLLKLAKEVNDEVAAKNPDSLTPDQLHKIAEIEKLAKSVRERMTAGVGEPPAVIPSPPLVFPSH